MQKILCIWARVLTSLLLVWLVQMWPEARLVLIVPLMYLIGAYLQHTPQQRSISGNLNVTWNNMRLIHIATLASILMDPTHASLLAVDILLSSIIMIF